MNIDKKTYMNYINESTNCIKDFLPDLPDICLVLGSGLGRLTEFFDNTAELEYKDIPHFPLPKVAGHKGSLIYGTFNGKKILAQSGRFHYYEGHSTQLSTLAVRVFARLGIKNIILTNAAGAISKELDSGDLMMISDHISFFCPSPLNGENLDEFGVRFPDMSDVYTKKCQTLARNCADKLGITLKNGIYAFTQGPQYETPAEIRALKLLGADAVGMSTVQEAIVAAHCNMNLLGISLITNKAAGLSKSHLDHKEVVKAAKNAQETFEALIKQIITDWNI